MWTQRRSGKTHQRGSQDHRDPYEHDRTRVIHSPSFRRLQGKTQIMGAEGGDFHRNRLTHSLEVASIGSSIVRSLAIKEPQAQAGLLPNDDLIQVICLLHDIGHPPFGHSGEVALNYMMRHAGGFEGNAHALRLLTKLETCYGAYGLDLTRRALLGVLKYPVPWASVVAHLAPSKADGPSPFYAWQPPKAYFDCEQPEVDWLLQPFSESDRLHFQALAIYPDNDVHGHSAHYSLDCSIMDMADDIAYGVHDLEDAIYLRLIHREHVDTLQFHELYAGLNLRYQCDEFLDLLFDAEISVRKQAIGELVNCFIAAAQITVRDSNFLDPLLKYNVVLQAEARALLDYCMHCIFTHVIDSHTNRTFQFGGQTVIRHLFEAYSQNPLSLLDHKIRRVYQEAQDETNALRIICDYIAGMTDSYAHQMHERLFGFSKIYNLNQ